MMDYQVTLVEDGCAASPGRASGNTAEYQQILRGQGQGRHHPCRRGRQSNGFRTALSNSRLDRGYSRVAAICEWTHGI
jgi:hypothetical protein